jgi:ParB family chromosome partitioning protein
MSTVSREAEVSRIRVGQRHRKDMGDLAALTTSIQELGLLQPLVVTPDLHLVAGARRLEAVKGLRWEKVPVRVVEGLSDALAALRAERDENTCRLDFTPSEMATLGKALEELERAAAKERQKEGGKAGGKASGKLPEASRGQTREKVAEALGVSGRTYEKAKEVAEAAEAEPEKYGDLKEEMDRTRKVDPAHKKLKKRGGGRSARTKAPLYIPRAAAALQGLVADGKVEQRDACLVADRDGKSEQARLAGEGPAAVAARARDLRWLQFWIHPNIPTTFDPGVPVSDEARGEALCRLRAGLEQLQRSSAVVAGWIAALEEKLSGQRTMSEPTADAGEENP